MLHNSENVQSDMDEYECECNDCAWHGQKNELETAEDDEEISVCPECLSEDIYYHS